MIRFQPDSLLQAFTRFFDMAAPDANIYVEIAAPDIRFAAIALLAIAALAALVLRRRLGPGLQPTLALLLVLFGSTAIWLYTTGNGRYFMPLIVCAGPLAVALICLLPLTRGFKATLAVLLVAGQAFVLAQQPPWDSWTLLHWDKAPYFALNLGPEETEAPPTTYASMSFISYSLIAPQFPANARWINLPANGGTARDEAWITAFLRDAAATGPLKVLAPSLPWATQADGQPTPAIIDAFNKLIGNRNLKIQGACRHIVSPGLVRIADRERRKDEKASSQPPLGFWSCPVVYEIRPSEQVRQATPPEAVERAFQKLGELCPRFFPGAEHSILHLPEGWTRHYAASETRVYVMDNGEVWYKFWRSFNPVFVGRMDAVLTGKIEVDCSKVRGSDGAWNTGSR
ncbi:MAG: hypothetical protein JWQ76_4160 [Ramlibacter sp.]|nr:hypothetical protein [Ramlibacter sp.]